MQILNKYAGEENGKNRVLKIIDNEFIISRYEGLKHEGELEITRVMRYKVNLEEEIQMTIF